MKTLQRYLLRQILASLLMTLGVFTFVILLGNVFKEVLPLLINRQATLGTVTEFVGLLIPYIWLYALPMSVLASILLVFGRFSADHELTAARASGISLVTLALPVLLLSLVLCGVCAAINLEIGPMCRRAYKDLRFQFLAEISGALLPERQFIRDSSGMIFYVGRNRQGSLEDIMIVQMGTNGAVRKIRADRGRLEVDPTNAVFRLNLTGVRGVLLEGGGERLFDANQIPLEFPLPKRKGERSASLSDLTFSDLLREYRALDRRLTAPDPGVTEADATTSAAANRDRERAETLSPIRVELHRKLALSCSCFGFALIGIPLGIRVQRRESNIGFALSLVLVVIYYAFVLVGSAFEAQPGWLPHLWMWAPNFLFQFVGAVLLWRVNRGL